MARVNIKLGSSQGQKLGEIVIEALKHRGYTIAEAEQILARLIKMGPDAEIDTAMLMPFGKYAGEPVSNIPESYLTWLYNQEWFEERYPKLCEQVSLILGV